MTAGLTGLASISWAQTRIDGVPGAPLVALRCGATWEWSGAVARLDPATSLALGARPVAEEVAPRARIARRAWRLAAGVPGATQPPPLPSRPEPRDALSGPGQFVVADGARRHRVFLMASGVPGRPWLVFPDGPPAPCRPLVLLSVRVPGLPLRLGAPWFLPGGFAPGTGIATPEGMIAVEFLAPGDRVLARDGGLRQVVCTVHWQGDGGPARLAAGLRAVTIRPGAFGPGHPARPLHLAPGQIVGVGGPEVRRLFGASRVLVPAARLAGLPGVVPAAGRAGGHFVRLVLDAPDLVLAEGMACAGALPPPAPGPWPEALAAGPCPRPPRALTATEAARLVHARALGCAAAGAGARTGH